MINELAPSALDTAAAVRAGRATAAAITEAALERVARLEANDWLLRELGRPEHPVSSMLGAEQDEESFWEEHGGFSPYGNPFSNQSATNPYATDAPRLYDQQGQYRGKLSANPYDPDSTSNPYGRYGSPFSPDSI